MGLNNQGPNDGDNPRNKGWIDDQNRFREGGPVAVRDLPRCNGVPQVRGSDDWEVTYSFRGRQHHIQTRSMPESTIVVDRRGTPQGWCSPPA